MPRPNNASWVRVVLLPSLAVLASCSFDLSRPPPDSALPDTGPSDLAVADLPACVLDSDCDDQQPCTDDRCLDEECHNTVTAGSCLIADSCRASGESSADSAWLVCHPSVSQSQWTVRGKVEIFAGSGAPPPPVDGPALSASFFGPYDLAVDQEGTIYVSDGPANLIRTIRQEIDGSWTVATIAGTLDPGHHDGPALEAKFAGPSGLAVDDAGNLFITDAGNHQIRALVHSTGEVVTYAGSGIPGPADGALAVAQFNGPISVDIDRTNNRLFVSDRDNDSVRIVDPNNVTTSVADDSLLKSPHGVLFAGGTTVYIADSGNHCIRKLEKAALSVVAGLCNQSGDEVGPAADARFDGPRDLALGAHGELFISDAINNQIKVLIDGQVYSLAGKAGVGALQDGVGQSARFNGPRGLAIHDGVLYVADLINGRIRRVTPAAP